MKEIGDNFFTFVALNAKGYMDNGHGMLRHFLVPFFSYLNRKFAVLQKPRDSDTFLLNLPKQEVGYYIASAKTRNHAVSF